LNNIEQQGVFISCCFFVLGRGDRGRKNVCGFRKFNLFMTKKIGLLLPKSVIYPAMSFDIMGGLRCGLAEAGAADTEIKVDSIGVAGDDKQIYAACEKLLFDGASVVAGYVNPGSAEKLAPLFAGANALFIALDAGYHLPSLQLQRHIFYLSLQGMLGCRMATHLAMADGLKNMAFTCSFYDSGYRAAFACNSALPDEGGNIMFNHITKLKRNEFTLEPLAEHLAASGAEAVFAAFCGDMLQDFFAVAAAGDVFKGTGLYGSPFVGDEVWLVQSLYPGVDVQVCVPWAMGVDNAANARFMAQLKAKNTNINLFSLLGYEAALVAAAAMGAASTSEAIALLEGQVITSPRGAVTIDAATHQGHAPMYEAVVRRNEATGNCVLTVLRESGDTEELRGKMAADVTALEGPMTSWVNAYGCLDS
jgi:branched-chain amino acid transport system substrate-binding protein